MDRKAKGSAVGTLSQAEIAQGLSVLSRSGTIHREEENILRMRNGAKVPTTHVLERADGGNPRARAKIDEIQAALFRRLFEETPGSGTAAKDKIVRSLKSKR